MSNQDLQTIDLAALAQVSGGATATATSTDDQLLTALGGILDSIKSLATQNNNGGINPQEMMLFMMMLNQRNQQDAAAAAALSGAYVGPPQPIVRYY